MKKYLLITPGYPCDENIYNNAFVHSRVKAYLEMNLSVDVFSIGKNEKTYTFDGIKVHQGNLDILAEKLQVTDYSKVLIHFAMRKIMKTVLKYKKASEVIIWVHGVEALGWYRRLFNLQFNLLNIVKFVGYIFVNISQMLYMRKLILKHNDVHFVFVSRWMKDILETDTFTINKIKKYSIIPNFIDTDQFEYKPKDVNQRFEVFNIRPYHSKKYANDIMVKVILELKDKDYFNKLTFNLYGDGRLFSKITSRLTGIENVKINKGFLKQKEIYNVHKKCGILLMPTRQDAQGVSMCEAMSSGLVPIVSNNTAIPEFVSRKEGYLCNNFKEMVEAIEELINSPKIFKNKSQSASKFILNNCSREVVIRKEVSLIKNEKIEA